MNSEKVQGTSKYLDAVNYQRLGVDAVRLDDSKIVPINGEGVIGIACYGYKSETVSFSGLHVDDGQRRRRTPSVASFPVNQR
jgi:hypothetical protein